MSTTERQQIVDSANAKVREMLGYWGFALGYWGFAEGDNVVSADGATVWAFHDAPSELQALSEHGGDEDWLVLWPPGTAGVRDTWVSATCGRVRSAVSRAQARRWSRLRSISYGRSGGAIIDLNAQ